MSTPGVSGNMLVSNIDISSMDIETALMAVQGERTRLLDAQLADQVKAVQDRNNQIASLNNALSALTAMEKFYGTDDGTKSFLDADGPKNAYDKKDGNSAEYKQFVQDFEAPLNKALADAGLTDVGFPAKGSGYTFDENGKTVSVPGTQAVWGGHVTKGQMETAITKIKGLIDNASNSQQMDMLRLQSLSNKRNEAFDVMTNFVKKMQDSRSSIIGNMR